MYIIIGITILLLINSNQGRQGSGGTFEEYYEEQCIDVSQYTAQGYTYSSTDEKGCTIVRKMVRYLERSLGRYTCACDSGCSGPDYCTRELGPEWYSIGCKRVNLRSGGYGTQNFCGMDIPDYKGGWERIKKTCHYDENDLLAAETFTGGQTITKESTRYPIKGFCRAHAAIITNDELKQSTTTTTVYQDLEDDNTFTIPEGETMTMFYIIENNHNLPTVCKSADGLALNVENELCMSTLGFTYLCSEGQYDALSGTCVVQPDSEKVCSIGRYDVATELCIYNPPLQVDCGDNGYYSINREICVSPPFKDYTCPASFDFEEPQNNAECSGNWDECPQCPIGQICPEDICNAECSTGQICTWESPVGSSCDNVTGNGDCNVNGSIISICGDDMDYNFDTKLCEINPSSKLVCESGVEPDYNTITNKNECLLDPTSYVDCGVDKVWDLVTEQCMDSISVYNPVTGEFVPYKQVNIGCTSDSQCEDLDETFTCNEDIGICHTDIFTTGSNKQITLPGFDDPESNFNIWYILGGGVLLLLILKRVWTK